MYRQQQQQRPAGDGHMGVDKGGWGALRGKGDRRHWRPERTVAIVAAARMRGIGSSADSSVVPLAVELMVMVVVVVVVQPERCRCRHLNLFHLMQ